MTSWPEQLNDAIRLLESRIDDKPGGLPEELFRFVSRITPLVNVDLLIRDDRLGTLLTWRDDDFYGPGWHIPGGIVRFREHAAARVCICAERELGARVDFDPVPAMVHESVALDRRDRAHFVSMLYRCRLVTGPDLARRYAGAEPVPGQWHWHRDCPKQLIPQQSVYRPFIG